MSAILKALRKLEEESETKEAALLSKTQGPSTRRQFNTILLPVLVLFVTVAVVGAGFMMFKQKKTVPVAGQIVSTDKTTVAAENPPATPAAGAAPQHQVPPVIKPEKVVPEAMPEQIQPEYAYSTIDQAKNGTDQQTDNDVETYTLSEVYTHDTPGVPAGTVSDENPVPPVPTTQEPKEPSVPSVADDLTSKPLSSPETVSAPPVREKSAARQPKPDLDVINDPAINLQAISWSTDPDKRMAIINGRICREKDRVGGYVIQAIYPGDVVISQGAVSGKLVFKIR